MFYNVNITDAWKTDVVFNFEHATGLNHQKS